MGALHDAGLVLSFVAAATFATVAREAPGIEAPPACRNLATELTAQYTAAGGFTANMKTTCSFNVQAKQSVCTVQSSDGRGMPSTTTTTTTFNSVADVIDEIAVNPPLTYALTAIATQVGTKTTTGGVTNTFDSARRILKTVNTSASGESTTTYSDWDQAGRPTRAHDVGKGFSNTRTISYDDTARTRTTVVNGGPLRTVETFDTNGNQIETLATAGGMAASTKTVITINTSQRVCK